MRLQLRHSGMPLSRANVYHARESDVTEAMPQNHIASTVKASTPAPARSPMALRTIARTAGRVLPLASVVLKACLRSGVTQASETTSRYRSEEHTSELQSRP